MGLGSTAKKIQTLADRAEQLYVKLKEVHERVLSVEGTVEDTQARVTELENALEHQRVVVEAIAEERGIDVDAVVAEAAIEDVDGEYAGDATEAGAAGSEAASTGDDADEPATGSDASTGDGAGEPATGSDAPTSSDGGENA